MKLARISSLMIAILFAAADRSLAQPIAQDQSRTQRLAINVHPAAAPVPALRYRLLPSFGQQTPGNAAPQYLIAFELLPRMSASDDVDVLLAGPLSALDAAKARNVLADYAGKFHQLELAANRRECQWDLPLREEGISTLLPHLSLLRQAARVLAVQARLEIAEGRFDDAVHTLRIGFSMAHHFQSEGLLVQGLVARGVAELMLDRVREFQQAPGAPNLYWALATLPKPLFDTQTIAQVEQAWVDFSFPELRGRPVEQLNDDELRGLFRHMKELQAKGGQLPLGESQNLAFAGLMAGLYGPAREYLLAHGRTEQQIRRMPVEAVLAPYVFNQARRWSDEVFKWAGVPYWQARTGIQRAQEENKSQAQQANNPLAMLLPAVDMAFLQFAQTERTIARLQCIEALRAYAAAHDGQFPRSLDDLTDTPAPLDPFTGKPFGYEARGSSATLTLEGVSSPSNVPQLVIEMRSI